VGRRYGGESKAKADTHEPGAKTLVILQAVEFLIGAKGRFLSHVLGVCDIAQNALSNAEGEWSALRQARLKGALLAGLGDLPRCICFEASYWLGQYQLLHS
jgi:hypothetical protein